MNGNMTRVSAPGLPAWPRLYLDPEKKRAFLSARLVTWRSQENSNRVCMLIFLIALFAATYFSWHWVQQAEAKQSNRVAICGLGLIVFIAIGKPLLTIVLGRFMAKVVFAKRIRAWFSPEGIAFRSHYYSKPVVLWRRWKNAPVQGRFDITDDHEAVALKELLDYKKARNATHLTSAKVLRVVIATINPNRMAGVGSQGNLVRSVPITEIDARDAQKFTMVLAAASSLTVQANVKGSESPNQPTDIDGI